MNATGKKKKAKNQNKNMADSRLQIIVDLVDKASTKLKGITGGLENFSSKAASTGLKMTAFGTAVGLALKTTVDASNELTNSLIGLSSVATAFGSDAGKAKEAAISLASDGLMSVSDAATGLKNLLASKFSLPEAITLMNAFKESAAFNRQSTLGFGEAIRGATEGLKNQNSILVDNAGVTKNLSNILTEAGYSAQDLNRAATDTGVRMALYNGILKETNAFTGDAARLSDTLAGAQARLETQVFMLKASMGEALSPSLEKVIKQMSEYLDKAMKWIKENPELTATILQITAALAAFTVVMGILLGVVAILTSPITLIVAALILLGAALYFFIKQIKDGIKEVRENFPKAIQYLKQVISDWYNDLKNKAINFKNDIINKITEAWSDLVNYVKTKIQEFINLFVGIGISIGNGLTAVWNGIKQVFSDFFGGMLQIAKFGIALVVGAFLLGFEALGIDLGAVWGNIKEGISEFTSWIGDKFSKMFDWLSEKTGEATGWLSEKWHGFWDDTKEVTNTVSTEINEKVGTWLDGQVAKHTESLTKQANTYFEKYQQIKTLTLDLYNYVSGIVKEKLKIAVEEINTFLEPIKQAFSNIWEAVKSATVSALNGVKDIVKGMMNGIIDMINSMIGAINKVATKGAEGLGISIPQIGKIPRLAKGGIVNSPTLAMIGEDGPEAVIPLNKKNAPGNMGTTINIVVNGDVTGEELIEKIGNALTRKLQLSTAVV